MASRPLEILLLYDGTPNIASTVFDHLRALERFSGHHIRRLSMLGDLPARLDLARFDAVLIHYTLVACADNYVSASARARLAAFGGLKAIFVQDDYRFIHRTRAAMREIGVHLVLTCVPDRVIEQIYPAEALPGVVKLSAFTGYVPDDLPRRAVPPYAARPIDIGYRGRKLSPCLGRLAQEKWRIAARVTADAPAFDLVTDISFREEDRIYGEAWNAFVSSCKAMLGVESGASISDFTGEIERQVTRHLSLHPNAGFEELEQLYFKGEDGKVMMNIISPRCFEAAALRTLMILYEGEYSGVLKPWRHYVPLRKDHANMAEVVAVLRNPARAEEIIERAYREVALDPRFSFAHGVADVDDAIDRVLRPEMLSAARPYSSGELRRLALFDWEAHRRRLHRALLIGAPKLVFGVLLRRASPQRRERIQRQLRRAYNALTRYERRLARREARTAAKSSAAEGR